MSEIFRLHPASIAAMAEFTLSFLITVYFLSLKDKTRDTWLIVGYVGLAMLVYLVDIGATSTRQPVYFYFRVSHLIVTFVWALFGTWCAYTYRSYPLRREGVIVIIIAGFLVGGKIVESILKYSANGDSLNFFSTYNVIIGLPAWSSFVLLRRSVIASNHRQDFQETMQSNLRNLATRPGASMRAFALLFASSAIFYLGIFIFRTSVSFHIGNMVLLLGVLVLHLNYANEVTTFQVKLVSLPLATTLALLGILPLLLFGLQPTEAAWYITDDNLRQQLRTFAWLIPCYSVFIIVAFVFFYWVGLIKPLGKLLDGVRRIEEGDLSTQVPVFTTDEIGHFAHGLNTMATSLKASYDELESRVAERTEQLQSSLVRLQATQTQLIHQEKMASLGELTAGIAHEIQNPLNFVNNFSDVNKELLEELKYEADKGNIEEVKAIASDVIENEEKINHHGKRADAIVKGMLQHSKASTGKKEPTDINALCDEYLRLAYYGLRAKDKSFNTDFTRNFDEGIGQVNIIPQDIGRVLLNLFNNAFYAVNEKSKSADVSYRPVVSVQTKKINDKIEIVVRDNGNGIPQKIVNKIFQPFFTTKPTGQGTGLGLSLAYDIIKAHGGSIKVETKEGQGTTEFTILLPC